MANKDSAWVTIASSYFLAEADFIRSLLESHEIPVFLKGEHTAGLAPPLSMLDRGIRIQVRREDEAQAMEILASHQHDDEEAEWDEDTPMEERLGEEPLPRQGSGRAVLWAVVTGLALAWTIFAVFFAGNGE